MNFNDYQRLALRTEKPLPTVLERLAHASLGLITEIGEIATEVKRMAIYGKPLDAERRAHIAEEVGDVLWYLAIGADALGFDMVQYVELVRRTDHDDGTTLQWAAMGLAASSGTVAAEVGAEVVGSADRSDREIRESLINIFHGLKIVALVINVPIEQIMADNIAKLQARFPDAYSNEAAEARADKGGLDARSS